MQQKPKKGFLEAQRLGNKKSFMRTKITKLENSENKERNDDVCIREEGYTFSSRCEITRRKIIILDDENNYTK